jgi:hypothetical protein
MNYVVVKLISGEEIMSATEAEDTTTLQLLYPMMISNEMYQDENGHIKKMSKMVPFCPASDDRIFNLNKSMILFVNPLHKTLIDSYKVLVEAYSMKDAMLNIDSATSETTVTEPLNTFEVPGNDLIH